ncbi:MAG: Gfo/Idh/MocA family oxidoreductase, partial [Gemmatimonadota bacterium]
QRAETELGCTAYADYRDLLARDDLDLVVNSLPSHLHPPVTIAALQAGHHVVCEKPLGWSPAKVDEMVAAARAAGRLLAPFQQSRYAPYFQQIRKVLASGALGRIVQIRIYANGFGRRWDWQTLQEFRGGNLLNTGPHFVDQAVCLLDFATPQVTCAMDRANTYGDAEDYVKVLLRAKDKPVVDLEISSCDAYPGDMYNISGTLGGLAGGSGGLRWRYYNPKKAPRQKLLRDPLPGPSYCRESLELVEKTWTPSKAQQNAFQYMSRCYYDHLYKVLRQGAPLEITPEQVRVQMQVMEACHRQSRLSRLPRQGWPKGN